MIHVAHQEPHLLVSRQTQQRALSQECQRLAIGLHLECGDVRFARNVATDPFHAIGHGDVDVAAHRCQELEPVRGVSAPLRRYIAQRHGLGQRQNVLADPALIVPGIRAGVLLALLGMTHRQQVRGDFPGECPLRYRRRAGHQQNLLRLIAGVVHQRHVQPGEAQAGASGNDHHGFHTLLGFVAAARRPHAILDPQRHWRIVARHRQGRRMDVGRQLELVVDHRVASAVGLQSQVRGVFRHQ